MKIDKSGDWRIYWGATPLPEGAEAIGTVRRRVGDTGTLIKLSNGSYMQGNAGSIRSLPQNDVIKALSK